MAAWRNEEVEAASHRQEKREATKLGNLLSHISPVLSTCPLHTNSGCGKERRILIGPW